VNIGVVILKIKQSIILNGLYIFCFLMLPSNAYANSAPKPEKTVNEEVNVFLPIEPISVAMYNSRKRPKGTMTVQLQLKIDDNDQRSEATKLMPRLRNAYMQETLKLALNFFDIDKPVNANLLSRTLQSATNIVLKHDQAKILVSDIAIHKR
jgi:flagellar basal body-associated protein FliL